MPHPLSNSLEHTRFGLKAVGLIAALALHVGAFAFLMRSAQLKQVGTPVVEQVIGVSLLEAPSPKQEEATPESPSDRTTSAPLVSSKTESEAAATPLAPPEPEPATKPVTPPPADLTATSTPLTPAEVEPVATPKPLEPPTASSQPAMVAKETPPVARPTPSVAPSPVATEKPKKQRPKATPSDTTPPVRKEPQRAVPSRTERSNKTEPTTGSTINHRAAASSQSKPDSTKSSTAGAKAGQQGAVTASTQPKIIEQVRYVGAPPRPLYPRASQRRKEQGKVVVRVVISPQGTVAQLWVKNSSGHPRLDQAALAAVRQVRFKPYTENGIAQKAMADIPFDFVL